MTNFVFESIIKIFAIIAKADGIAEEEILVFERFLKSHFDDTRYRFFKNYFSSFCETIEGTAEEMHLIATQVSAELSTEQRFLIYIRLNELVRADGVVSPLELEFLGILAKVFHLSEQFTTITTKFVFIHKKELLKSEDIGIIDSGKIYYHNQFFALNFKSNSEIGFCFLKDLGFFILKVLSSRDQLVLNNESVKVGVNYFLRPGSVLISEGGGQQLHFSSLWSSLHNVAESNQNVLSCHNLEYHHPNGKLGLHEFNFTARSGDLIAIMGPSGSGKSTLLNIINGNYLPSKGSVEFNGNNIYDPNTYVKQYFGYVPQDDLLIEDLTVFQNLYLSALLSLPEITNNEVEIRVDKLLHELGLYHVKHLKVGNSLSKTISGGQRKRLNISLELIREPTVLFVDEPTSGLSSRDSDNIMSLLRDLCFKGTIIFTVIHQPSSDIYKLFDQLVLLDVGGYSIYTGNPIEAVAYFKKSINHISSHISTCPTCGNINPEVIFNIIESKVIDEFGNPISDRRINPLEWFSKFRLQKEREPKLIESGKKSPRKVISPSLFLQISVFFKRDFLSKLANKQYLIISLGEPIVLAFILAFIVRYFPVSTAFESSYYFSENVNLPSFIFISIIVSLFMGLTLSAEEIFKDQKILKREEFLMLSRFGYLVSKISIQFIISLIQSVLFTSLTCLIIGNIELFWQYFIVLFSCACFANLLALNISSSFPRIITIYITIPVLLIPQLILGGIIVNFDKMNPALARYGKVPFIGDLMASRWAFEAACIMQFKDNSYDSQFFKINKEISKASFKLVYWLPEMNNITNELNEALMEGKPQKMNQAIALTQKHYPLLLFEIKKENNFNRDIKFNISDLKPERIELSTVLELEKYLANLERYYRKRLDYFQLKKDRRDNSIINKIGKEGYLKMFKQYHNEALERFVKRSGEENRILHADGHLVQQIDPIYNEDFLPLNFLDYRSHFFSPYKYFAGIRFQTFAFNICVIWLMVFALFLSLYFDVLKRLVEFKFKK
jgi:ABC-type multidrug transport system ATPase subunit